MIFVSYVFLIIGVIVKKYTFLIPYFTLCVLLILILTLKLFVELMSTANTKDTLEPHRLHKLSTQVEVGLEKTCCKRDRPEVCARAKLGLAEKKIVGRHKFEVFMEKNFS